MAGKIAGLGSLFATVRTHDAGDDGVWVDKAGADVYVPKGLLEHVGRSERTPLAVGQRVLVSAERREEAASRKEAGVDYGRYKWVATALELAPHDAGEDLDLHGSKDGVGLAPTERGGGGGREDGAEDASGSGEEAKPANGCMLAVDTLATSDLLAVGARPAADAGAETGEQRVAGRKRAADESTAQAGVEQGRGGVDWSKFWADAAALTRTEVAKVMERPRAPGTERKATQLGATEIEEKYGKGFAMLAKMGYTHDNAELSNRTPIAVAMKTDKKGLYFAGEQDVGGRGANAKGRIETQGRDVDFVKAHILKSVLCRSLI